MGAGVVKQMTDEWKKRQEELSKGCGKDFFFNDCKTPDKCDGFIMCPKCWQKLELLKEAKKLRDKELDKFARDLIEKFKGMEIVSGEVIKFEVSVIRKGFK